MKRADFIASVEQRLARVGFKPASYRWMPRSAGLVLIVNGGLKDLPIRCGMKRVELERWLGRAEGWADMLGLNYAEGEGKYFSGNKAASSLVGAGLVGRDYGDCAKEQYSGL